MLLAVLHFGLVLVTILVAGINSSCLFPKTCQCGNTGKNYTRCYNTIIEQYSCDRWSNCLICESNYELCVKCPPGRSGPTCKEGSCPFLKRPKNGRIQCSYDSTGFRSCTGRCFPGYYFENHRMVEEITLNCVQNTWTPHQNIPDCKSTGRDCNLQGTGNHSYNCTIGMHGSYCDINCEGQLEGRYYCYPGRGWNSTLPSCVSSREQYLIKAKKEVICSDPGIPKDGGRTDLKGNSIPLQHTFREGDTVLYFCKRRNAHFEKITYLTCKPDTTWGGDIPQCTPSLKEKNVKTESSCKHPGVVENGIIEDFESDTEQFPVGTELRFLCREGYQMQGPEAIYCLLNLSWSEAPPVCTSPIITTLQPTTQLFCKHPGTVENGFIVDDVPETQMYPLGSELKFQCLEGHELVGAKTIFCLHSVNQHGYWSDVPPLCKYANTTRTSQVVAEIYCKHPGMVENSIIENYAPETERFAVGTALKYQCRRGYELIGPINLYCMRNGEWSLSPPNCRFIPKILVPEVSCVHPGMVDNGRFEGDLSKSSFPVGTALKINCNAHTQIQGPMTIFCLYTGQWSQTLPTCKPVSQQIIEEAKMASKLCKDPGTIENGLEEYSTSKLQVYPEGSEIKFKCRDGYTLDGPNTLRCLYTGEWTATAPTCRPTKKIPDCGRVFQDIYKQTGKYTRSDWPWTVSISTGSEDDVDKIFCGGALLNSKTVLTAAHCATSSRNINLHFGHRRQSGTENPVPEQVRTVQISRIVIHPEYDDETHANDIALMKFEHHVYYDRRTQTVCLPTPTLSSSGENLLPGTITIVTGYGLHFATNHSTAAKFLMLELPLQNERQCEDLCRNQGLVSCNPSTFCAGYPKNVNDCVYGGSPLVVFHPEKNRYTLEGLVTRAESARNKWNGRCKRPENYMMFTNVTNFMPFIMKHMNSRNE